MTLSKRSLRILGLLFTIALAGTGCAKKGAGTTVTSQAYNTPVASLHFMDWLIPSAVATTAVVTDFKFCVTEFKLEGPEGSEVGDVMENGTEAKDLEDNEHETKVGLVDLGDGTKSVSWGAAPLPAGTVIKKVKVEIHKDPELCKVDYSASINGQTITKDLEFKFTFADPKTVASSDTLTVALTTLITKLTAAAQAGQLDDSHIEAYLDGSFEDECK